jgi:phosphoribosylanthranilate isomerase
LNGAVRCHSIAIVPRTRIKFCGITRPADAIAAAAAGADAIGLVFCANSSRRITIEQATQILAALPPMITPVGLFADSYAAEITRIVQILHLTHIQLHGNEPPEFLGQLPNVKIFKAIRVEKAAFAGTLKRWKATRVSGLLLETPGTAGGSGIENDWETIIAARESGQLDSLPPIIAAGGLRPENVAAVIRRLRPFAVDVSSGIESGPGIKSVEKMAAFAAAVRGADETGTS